MSTACINEAKKGYCVYWIATALFLSIAAIGYIPPLLVGQSLGTTTYVEGACKGSRIRSFMRSGKGRIFFTELRALICEWDFARQDIYPIGVVT